MSFPPTEEQAAIISAAASRSESLMIFALAGTGKTTTLKLLVPQLPTKSVLALAFNKKNAEDLVNALPSYATVKTFNSLGHSAYASAIGRRLTLDDGKVAKLTTEYTKGLGGVADEEWANLRNLVKRARISGLVPASFAQSRKSLVSDDSWGWEGVADQLSIDLTEDLMKGAREILTRSINLALAGTIDFDDQIYMSTLFSGLYNRFHTVIGDESQDISELNRIQIQKSCLSRLIIAGDPKQAIYAFRGADSSSMSALKKLKSDWIDLPLTITWRCPKAIVERQWDHAPDFRAGEGAPDGEVIDWREKEEWTFIQNAPYWEQGALHLEPAQAQLSKKNIAWFDTTAVPSLAILCRNNAPLISLAFALIRKRIGINMLGRDFGKSLSALTKKICGDQDALPIEVCSTRIREWSEREIRLARAADKEEKIDRIRDQAESLFAIAEHESVRILSDLRDAITLLFDKAASGGQVILSSGHKAKGLEWHTVLHLDPWRIPSKWARLARDEGNEVPWQQEMNLKYVIETRAKHTLILANLEDFQ